VIHPLILASSSPYRKELLSRSKSSFFTVSPDVDETPLPGETPHTLACRLARAKAQIIAAKYPGHIVIGADQAASLNGQPLGKPGNRAGAQRQLRALSGQSVIFTAPCQWRLAIASKQSTFPQPVFSDALGRCHREVSGYRYPLRHSGQRQSGIFGDCFDAKHGKHRPDLHYWPPPDRVDTSARRIWSRSA